MSGRSLWALPVLLAATCSGKKDPVAEAIAAGAVRIHRWDQLEAAVGKPVVLTARAVVRDERALLEMEGGSLFMSGASDWRTKYRDQSIVVLGTLMKLPGSSPAQYYFDEVRILAFGTEPNR